MMKTGSYFVHVTNVDHATLNRWVIRYSPLIASEAQKKKQPVSTSWRMDETYIKVKGEHAYLYLDFGLNERHSNTLHKNGSDEVLII